MGFGRRDGERQAPKTRRVLGTESSRPIRTKVSSGANRRRGAGSWVTLVGLCLAGCLGGVAVFGPPVAAMNMIFGSKQLGGGKAMLPGEAADPSYAMKDVLHVCLPAVDDAESSDPRAKFWRRVDGLVQNNNARLDDPADTLTLRTRGFGNYLTCAMDIQRDRLCDREHREGLAAEIAYYFASLKSDFVRTIQLHVQADQDEDFMAKINRLERTGGDRSSRELNVEEGQKTNPPNPKVVARMRSLIADGYLSKSDFRGALLPGVRDQFKDVVLGLDKCNDI